MVVAVLVFGPASSHADDECFRIGVEAWKTAATNSPDDMFSIVGERNLGPVGLRGRIGHGTVKENADIIPPGAWFGDVELWSATIGVESRARISRDGSIAGFAGIGAGAMRLSGGYLGGTEHHGHVVLQLGLDLRTAWLRTRPHVGLSMRVNANEDASSRLGARPVIGLGFEAAL